MDKIYVDDAVEAQNSYNVQINRYKRLDDSVRDAMLAHEVQDYTLEYRMTEEQTKTCLESIGFKNYKIIDRVERDIVISVEK